MPLDDSRRVSLLLGLLFGLAGLGSSSAAVALPLMGEDLGVGIDATTWAISLYVLFLAVTTAVYGRVSDLWGVRAPLTFGIGLMTAGALGAALAPSFEVLLVARMFQGAGAAAVPTLGIAALSRRYDGEVRGLALGRERDAHDHESVRRIQNVLAEKRGTRINVAPAASAPASE